MKALSTTDRARRALVAVAALTLSAVHASSPSLAIGEPSTDERAAFERVAALFEARCLECHSGSSAETGMRLESDWIYRSTVNVPAHSDRTRRRVDPGEPERSELFLRLLPQEEGRYRGPRMPFKSAPLTDHEIEIVRDWIESFSAEVWPRPKDHAAVVEPAPRTFVDSHITNLPSPDSLGNGILEFRILHRFRDSAEGAGLEGLYGLDSGAEISFGLTYGITDRTEIGFRRTNFQRDYELFGKFSALRQRPGGSPVSLAFQTGVAVIDADGRANRTSVAAQALLARRVGRRLSLMIAPTYVSRTNFLDASDDRGTTAIGVGGELRWNSFLSTSVEWIGQLSGVEAPYESTSIGFSITTSKHVFQLLVTNTRGMHTDLYAPGGDLDFGDGDFRFGFNISRLFDLKHAGSR